MRKLLFIILIAFSVSTFAQTTTATTTPTNSSYKKFTVFFSAGASVPIQAYGKKTFNTLTTAADTSNITGFAATGLSLNLSVSYKFVKNLGVMLQASQNINQFNNAAYASAINTAAGGVANYNQQNIQTSSTYQIGQYLLGLCLSIPLEENISFEAHALLGQTTASNPRITQTETTPYDKIVATTQYGNGSGFGYNVGLGLKCMFNKTIGIQVTGSYAGAKINYPGYSYYYTDDQSRRGFNYYYKSYSYSSTSARYMSMGMINITAGLAFSF